MFWGMGNQLGQFSEDPDWPEGQEWDVGGPEPLRGGNFYVSKNQKNKCTLL